MNFKYYRPARALGLVLAATVAFGSSAMAADVSVASVNEQDAPVIVNKGVSGTALGVGSSNVLGVYVRENPTTDAAAVSMVAQGQNVLVLSKEGDWYQVSVDGVTGFVKGDYLTVTGEGTGDFGYGLVKCSAANIRTEASSDSETLECVAGDDVVTITGITNGWYQVSLGDEQTGYVRSDLVDPTADIPAEKIYDYAVIDRAAVNLRTEPDSSAAKADVLYDGSLCTLVQQVGDWYQVEYSGKTGYVLASLVSTTNSESDGSTEVETLTETEARQEAEAAAAAEKAAEEAAAAAAAAPAPEAAPAPAPAASNDADDSEDTYEEPAATYEDDSNDYVEPTYEEETYEEEESYSAPSYDYSSSSDIVSIAEQYLGVPYVWGGTSPSGFDCSGFVQYVFRQAGYSISRTADTQYYDGTPVSYSDLQPGDVIFFERTYNEYGITHVGIYIGGGQFIHAGGGQVQITDLSMSYYSSRYYGACRIA